MEGETGRLERIGLNCDTTKTYTLVYTDLYSLLKLAEEETTDHTLLHLLCNLPFVLTTLL